MFYFLMVAIRPYLIVKNELHRNVEPDYFIDQHYSFLHSIGFARDCLLPSLD